MNKSKNGTIRIQLMNGEGKGIQIEIFSGDTCENIIIGRCINEDTCGYWRIENGRNDMKDVCPLCDCTIVKEAKKLGY